MKRRARFPLTGLALIALAGGLELLIVDGTLSGKAPLQQTFSDMTRLLEQKATPATASAQPMYIWKDASGVTHITETPPPANAAKKAKEYQFSPQPAVSAPPPVAPLETPQVKNEAQEQEMNVAIEAVRKEREQAIEQLRKERAQLEKQFIRARNTGDGYAQTRFRTLLERNREALEQLAPAK